MDKGKKLPRQERDIAAGEKSKAELMNSGKFPKKAVLFWN